jgi:hypothetical protein
LKNLLTGIKECNNLHHPIITLSKGSLRRLRNATSLVNRLMSSLKVS